MTEINLETAAEVYCKDEQCGMLHRVLVDSRHERITDLIVEREAGDAPDRIIPVALVRTTDDQGVHLCIREEKLDTVPAYEEVALEV